MKAAIGVIILLVCGIASWLFFSCLPRIDQRIDSLSDRLEQKTSSTTSPLIVQEQQLENKLEAQDQRINKLEKSLAILVTALIAV